MRAGADGADDALALEVARVLDDAVILDLAQDLLGVDVEEETAIDVIGPQLPEQVLEIPFGDLQIAAHVVLLVEVDRAEHALDDHLVAFAAQAPADLAADVVAGHEDIDDVHTVVEGGVDHRVHLRETGAVQMFGAQADHAHLHTGVTEFPVLHALPS